MTDRRKAQFRHAGQAGFSLVELSIVILIMGLLLGGIALPLAQQRDNARFKEAERQLVEVRDALEGHVLVAGALPCPATPASAGSAVVSGGGCGEQHGFVPATTLSLRGSRNADNLLLDPWGSPLRYSVSASDSNGNGQWDFVAAADLRAAGIAALAPELTVCRRAAGASATACGSGNDTLTVGTPAIVYSLGKDWAGFSSADQVANVGRTLSGGPSGERYRTAADAVFVDRGRSTQSGSEFDDVVEWIPSTVLYKRLLDAGVVP